MTTNKEREWLLRDKYEGVESEAFYQDLERLESGEPLAYVIGWVPFLNTRIHLDSKPLIPRPETEHWVDMAISEMKKSAKPLKILDLCAGSGAIGVAVLQALPNALVNFVEIDGSHHPTILKNLEEAGVDDSRFKIIGGDLFENVTDSYDFILTNPPYIDPALSRTEAPVLEHEPHLALFGGQMGMEIVNRILKGASLHLNAGGVMYTEHEPEQMVAMASYPLYAGSYEDQYGVARFSIFRIP